MLLFVDSECKVFWGPTLPAKLENKQTRTKNSSLIGLAAHCIKPHRSLSLGHPLSHLLCHSATGMLTLHHILDPLSSYVLGNIGFVGSRVRDESYTGIGTQGLSLIVDLAMPRGEGLKAGWRQLLARVYVCSSSSRLGGVGGLRRYGQGESGNLYCKT